MTGLFLISVLLIFIISVIITTIRGDWGYSDEIFPIISTVSTVSSIILVILLIAIPVSRLNSKTNVQEAIVLQETLNYNRKGMKGNFNSFERAPLMQHVITANKYISTWQIKGEYWYQNKWYYHPSTQTVKYIK